MPKRNWKRQRATSLRHGIELCLAYARERHNRSVDRVAELMGLANKWSLYKWMENGRMPAALIRPFEHACGATYLTDYLAASAHKVTIDVPAGNKATQIEVAELQRSMSYAVEYLVEFYAGNKTAEDTVTALNEVLKGAAWHRENVNKSAAPELALFEGDGE